MRLINEDNGEISWWVVLKFVPQNNYDARMVMEDFSEAEDNTLSIEA